MKDLSAKIIVIFLFALGLAASQDLPTASPEACVGTNPNEYVYLPYPGNCRLFIECWDFVGTVFECAENTWFYPAAQNCTWPGPYCDWWHYSTVPTGPPEPTVWPGICRDADPDAVTLFPYPGDCSKFIECFKNTGLIRECRSGLWFDPNRGSCEAPGEYCTDYPYPTGTISPDFCEQYDPDTVVHLPYPGNCSLFIECYAFLPTVLWCGIDLWWNPETDSCQEPGPFCEDWHTTPTRPTVNPGWCADVDPNLNIYIPYPDDCSRYIECYHGHGYYYECPEGLWWNPRRNQCDVPGDYCEWWTTTEGPPLPTVSPVMCYYANPTEIVFYPYPNDCSRYIECFDYIGYVYQCSDELWWHEEIHNCDYPGAYCSNEWGDRRCRGRDYDYLPDYWSCSRYIECYQGDSYDMVCPEGLFFDSQSKECREPQNSDCCRTGGYCN